MAARMEHYHLTPPIFDAPTRALIVIAPYYKDIADQQLIGAKVALEAAKVMYDVVEVPGALEIPPAISIADKSGEYDAYVALGCVIRGETTHYDTVCNDSSRGIMVLGLNGLAVGNGILTVENEEQAIARADATGQNKGGGAAQAALHLVALKRRFNKSSGPKKIPGEFKMAGHADPLGDLA